MEPISPTPVTGSATPSPQVVTDNTGPQGMPTSPETDVETIPNACTGEKSAIRWAEGTALKGRMCEWKPLSSGRAGGWCMSLFVVCLVVGVIALVLHFNSWGGRTCSWWAYYQVETQFGVFVLVGGGGVIICCLPFVVLLMTSHLFLETEHRYFGGKMVVSRALYFVLRTCERKPIAVVVGAGEETG